MTTEEVKDRLVEEIVSAQGIKGPHLAAAEDILSMEDFDFPQVLDELVAEGRVVEVEYVLPTMSYRAKSFFLPAGTKVRVIGEHHGD